jgi:hypothetical protein
MDRVVCYGENTLITGEEIMMRTAMRRLIWLGVLVLPLAGCGGHAGMGHHGSGGREAAAERGLNEMRGLIDAKVKDPEKARQAREIVEAIMAEVRATSQQQRKLHEQLYQLNAKYDAPRDEFVKILDELNNRRMKTGATILDLRFKLKALLTADEWAALSQGLNEARGRYRHGAPPEAEGKTGGY